jgi:cellulose synthase/poly-beta-1,6-N-acetylglucosamine synthase-like glycosyltransferase
VIVPAFNEVACLSRALSNLYFNPYINNVICVNDGSTDGTGKALDRMAAANPRLIAVHQQNTGKGGALMNGLRFVQTDTVFLTDADTYVPRNKGLGHLLSCIEAGADAVGGIPSSNLRGAGMLPFIRATVKFPMIIIKRQFQQILGGAPFIVSGACGLFRTDVLRKVGLSDRTKVEDLDLTWTLVRQGYRVRQNPRCVVYPQECNSIAEDWRRWRRWIVGYAVCMRLHWPLIFTRFGLFSMLPMFALVIVGVATYGIAFQRAAANGDGLSIPMSLFPLLWLGIVFVLGMISALHHNRLRLIPLAPLAVIYVALSYSVWVIHGLRGFVTGREPPRDKPTRYAHVVA